jgi:hypothetical protein
MKLPFDTDCAAGAFSNRPGFFVLFSRLPRRAGPDLLRERNRPGVLAMIEHEFGCDWPDLEGEAMTVQALEDRGVVIWQFAGKRDALTAYERIRRELRQ